MAAQVKVTLTALNGNLSPAERTLNLDPDRRAIPIGRASKSLSKGLQGATDNAWFDSPVMSRDHAELLLNAETKKLLIQDIGSMHGTTVNKVDLPRNEYRELENGDVVIFGAEVRRGPDTFPACTFRVNYEFLPHKAANTFAFPDSSDIEDEEDYAFSDEDLDNEQVSSEDGVSIESPQPKMSRAIDAIDLTRDESPVNSSFNSIDLTGDNPAEKRLMDLMAGRVPDINDDVSINAMYGAGTPHVEVEDDEVESHLSSEGESQSEVIVLDESGSSEGYELDEIEDSEDEDAIGDDDDEMDAARKSSLQDGGVWDSKSLLNATDDTHPTENTMDDDDRHDFGLVKAGAEGIRVMMSSGLLQNKPDVSYQYLQESPESSHHFSHYQMTYESESGSPMAGSKHATFAHPTRSADMKSSTSQLSPESLTGQHIMLNPLAQGPREPSPSDAAMAKPADLSIYHMPTTQFCQHAAQSLGEKSGKEDFFKAREYNKAKLQIEMQHETLPSGTSLLPNYQHTTELQMATAPPTRIYKTCVGSRSRFSSNIPKAKFPESSIPCSSTSTDEVSANFSTSSTNNSLKPLLIRPIAPSAFPSFLDKPDQSPISYRAPSPLPDMTSAVKYNESKASMAATTNKSTAQPHVVRSGLRIDEIIDRNSVDQSSTSLKRKSNAISNAVEEEVRIWGSALKSSNGSFTSQPRASAKATAVQDSEVPQAPEQRPAKRLKKLMESVAYAALGGVAVGAALFGGLVATAPDFM